MAPGLAKGARRPMKVIWIVCPTTGKDVSTGIETEEESFAMLPGFTLSLTCPECGAVHLWADMGGHLVETPMSYQKPRLAEPGRS